MNEIYSACMVLNDFYASYMIYNMYSDFLNPKQKIQTMNLFKLCNF